MEQLPLGLPWRHDVSFDNFVAADASLIAGLRAALNSPSTVPGVYLHGVAGSGRSHLLHALAKEADALGQHVAVIDLAHPQLRPEMLDGLEQCQWLCLDNLDAVTSEPEWANALFALFNAARDRGHSLAVSALLPAAQLNCVLPDLRSRLASLLVVKIPALDDLARQRLLVQWGEQKGLRVPEDVALFLLSRYSREIAALRSALETLDKASLQEQRRLTIPFVKQVLAL